MTPRRISVRVDGALSDDLALLSDVGLSASDAVRMAVAILAQAHRAAWQTTEMKDGARMTVVAVTVEPYDAVSDAVPPQAA